MKQPFARAALFYVALTLAITFPLVLHLTSTFPADLGDPLLSASLLWWNAHVLPLTERWWNGMAFAPATGMLAFSDHRLGLSLMATPLQWLGASPITAYNVVFLATFPLCALAAHALGFTLTRRHDAALVCGLAYGFNPFRVAHLSHLELLAAFGIPAALAALHMFLRDRRMRWLVLFAIALFIQGLSATYYLLFFFVLLALWLIWFVRPREWRIAAAIGAASACGVVPLVPIALEYWRVHRYYGFSRGLEEVRLFSADLTSFVTASPVLRVWGFTGALDSNQERQLFPGLTVVVLALAGIFVALRRARSDDQRWRRASIALLLLALLFTGVALSYEYAGMWRVSVAGVLILVTDSYKPTSIALLALTAALAMRPSMRDAWQHRSSLAFYALAAGFLFLCSMGPSPTFLGTQILSRPPFEWLRALPTFDSVRAPARFAMPAVLALAAAAALAFNRLALTASQRKALAAAAIAGIIADGWIAHVNLLAPPTLWPVPAAYEFGPVLELPLSVDYSDFVAMYRGTLHGHPVVNGQSGFFPPHYNVMQAAFDDQDAAAFDAFTQPAPLLVVVDKVADRSGRWDATVRKVARAQRISSDSRWTLYGIPSRPAVTCGASLEIGSVADAQGPVNLSSLRDENLATSWRTQGSQQAGETLVIDLGHPARVCAVRMAPAPVSMVALSATYPRGLEAATSLDGTTWSAPVFNGSTAGLTIRGALDDPTHIWLTVPVPADQARFIRLRLNAPRDAAPWIIPELRVLGP